MPNPKITDVRAGIERAAKAATAVSAAAGTAAGTAIAARDQPAAPAPAPPQGG